MAWRDPPGDEATRRWRAEERSRRRDEAARRNAEIRATLVQIPRFDLPNRTYYLLEGPVAAVTQLRNPASSSDWLNADLVWPDDRQWFVATDVDFWSLYIGGDHDFIAEVASAVTTRTEIVALDRQLVIED